VGKVRRTEVLDAARRLFFERGYRGTTVQQIAAAAGYSKRTVYLDYLNKDELFISVCAEGGEMLLGELRAIPARELSAAECMDRFLELYIRFSQERGPYFRMIFSEATPAIIGNCSPELRERVAELEGACLGILAAWAAQAIEERRIARVDPWDVVGILVGSATGIILLSMGASQTLFSPDSREALVRKAGEIIWQGLGALSAAEPEAAEEGK